MAHATHDHDHAVDEKKIEPKVDVKEVGPCRLHLRIEVEAAKVKERIDHKYQDLNDKMSVPGFRAGKAPRNILERKYGEAVREEVKFELLTKSFEEAKEAKSLEPLGEPDIDVQKIELKEGAPFAFEFEMEVRPTFTLKPYAGLAVKKPSVEVADKEIDEQLERLRESHAELVPTEDGAKEKDNVTADFALVVGDKTLDSSENNAINLVPDISFYGQELPDFHKKIAGQKAGAEVEVPITLPADFHDKSAAGKPAVIRTKIKSVKRRRLPEVTAEFAKTFDLDSVEELRQDLKKHLAKSKEAEAKEEMGEKLVDLIIKDNPFPLPAGYVKDRSEAVEKQVRSELLSEGLPEAEAKKKLEKELSGSKERIERALREELILEQIAKQEKIFVTEDQVEERLFKIAGSMGRNLHEVRSQFEEQGLLAHLRRSMRHEAVRDLIVSKAKTD